MPKRSCSARSRIANLGEYIRCCQICNPSLPLYGCLSEGPQWATSCMGCKEIPGAQSCS
ncbi:hypothetical protein M378DRAFT_386648 [Amanita muscaria Koide BX008]|uniref:Uncharacterized protein n=1 Tax=Amanita muscaria (strain Koide BX008) TaxID=946122 RepID=A0A0C2XBY6_AMAMK|nr:hypothetical protein M378DRAFT_386648 [Amanita muscaria Koide BX008]